MRIVRNAKTAPWLHAYFRSGWAFFIPYLATYFLYAWLQWPVNGPGENPGPSTSVLFRPPPLLHAYWLLHGLHLMFGGLLVIRALSSSAAGPAMGEGGPDRWTWVPWGCLALFFWIPGAYLEFPADPWEHYARINQWAQFHDVGSASSWLKSSYFFAYSVVGHVAPPLLQLRCLDAYYTGCCLLLCWQYFRLARMAGLGERASMIFVVLQALLMGNNVFGFYRYYGLSSSVFAQLGAVALVRLALEAASNRQLSPASLFRLPSANENSPPSAVGALIAGVLLFAFTAANHVQGLGIAGLGVAAVVVWRLIEWRRSMAAWLALGAMAFSAAAILWFPREPALDEVYRPQGWFTAWFGFNLFQPSSPAFERAMAILGAAGVVNLLAGFWLLPRNHIAAWLTVLPAVALCLPFVAIPYFNLLIHSNQAPLVFHRMLFAIPAGLALVTVGADFCSWARKKRKDESGPSGAAAATPSLSDGRKGAVDPFSLLIPLALCALVLIPTRQPGFSRLYNVLMRPPADLSMRHVLADLESPALRRPPSPVFIATTGTSYVAYSSGVRNAPLHHRTWHVPARDKIVPVENLLAISASSNRPAIFLPPTASRLFTPLSLTAFLSGHWGPHEVALEHANGPETEQLARSMGLDRIDGGFMLRTPTDRRGPE